VEEGLVLLNRKGDGTMPSLEEYTLEQWDSDVEEGHTNTSNGSLAMSALILTSPGPAPSAHARVKGWDKSSTVTDSSMTRPSKCSTPVRCHPTSLVPDCNDNVEVDTELCNSDSQTVRDADGEKNAGGDGKQLKRSTSVRDVRSESGEKGSNKKKGCEVPFQCGWRRECVMGPGRRVETVHYLTPGVTGSKLVRLTNKKEVQKWLMEHRTENGLNLTTRNFSFKKAVLGFGVKAEIVVKQGRADKAQCPVCKKFFAAWYLDRHRERKHGEKMEEEGKVVDLVRLVDRISDSVPSEQVERFPNKRLNSLIHQVKQQLPEACKKVSGSSRNQEREKKRPRNSGQLEFTVEMEAKDYLDKKTTTRRILKGRNLDLNQDGNIPLKRKSSFKSRRLTGETTKMQMVLEEERQINSQEGLKLVASGGSGRDWTNFIDWEVISQIQGRERIEKGKVAEKREDVRSGGESSSTACIICQARVRNSNMYFHLRRHQYLPTKDGKEFKRSYVLLGCGRSSSNTKDDRKRRNNSLEEMELPRDSNEGSNIVKETRLVTCDGDEKEVGGVNNQCREVGGGDTGPGGGAGRTTLKEALKTGRIRVTPSGRRVVLASCPVCKLVIRQDNLSRHLARMHGTKEQMGTVGWSSKRSKVEDSSSVASSNRVTSDSDGSNSTVTSVGVISNKTVASVSVTSTRGVANVSVISSSGVASNIASVANSSNMAIAVTSVSTQNTTGITSSLTSTSISTRPVQHNTSTAVAVSSCLTVVSVGTTELTAPVPVASSVPSSTSTKLGSSKCYTQNSSDQSHSLTATGPPHDIAASTTILLDLPTGCDSIFPVPPTADNNNRPAVATSGVATAAPCVASPLYPDRINFTMRGLSGINSSGHGKAFSVSMRPSVFLEKAMAAFGAKFGVDHKCLQFLCKGKVLTGDQLVSDVMGCMVLVRSKKGTGV